MDEAAVRKVLAGGDGVEAQRLLELSISYIEALQAIAEVNFPIYRLAVTTLFLDIQERMKGDRRD